MPGGGGGSVFCWKIQEGGVSRRGGAEGPGGSLRRIGELGAGGLNIFFGAEMPTKSVSLVLACGKTQAFPPPRKGKFFFLC